MNNRVLKNRLNQRGVAAVEFAFVLPVLVLVIAVTLFFGRICWHYTVAQKAAHDAVIMLANATTLEIATARSDGGAVGISNLAKALAIEEIAELSPGAVAPHVEVTCDGSDCIGDTVPVQVRVLVRMKMSDILLGGFTDDLAGNEGLWIRADVRMPYVGN
jgi:Flp pilus assembly protein TadG